MMSISMNLSSERKQSMKSLLTVISVALASVSPAFAGIEWGFPNDATTVVGTSLVSPGTGNATITFGGLATGWHDGTSVPWNLGSVPGATGLWDLGQAGSIVLAPLSGSGLTTLNVFQWVNPGTYSGTLNFVVSGGSSGGLSAVTQIGSAGLDGGAWWEYAANLGSLTPGQTVTISTGTGGAIIDRLTLVPEPATLVAGAILLIPLALSTWPILRRRAKQKAEMGLGTGTQGRWDLGTALIKSRKQKLTGSGARGFASGGYDSPVF